MIHTFHCPNCHASLDHNTDEATVRCPYCNTSVIIPEVLRQRSAANSTFTDSGMSALLQITQLARQGKLEEAAQLYQQSFYSSSAEAEQIVRQMQFGSSMSSGTTVVLGQENSQRASSFGCGCVLVLLVLALSLGVGAWLWVADGEMTAVFSTIEETLGTTATTSTISSEAPVVGVPLATNAPSTATPAPSPTPAFAELALQFGSQGSGPGRFDDTRAIAVDGEGQIYAADYSYGRIQIFNPAGQFLTTYNLGEDVYVPTMFASRDGANLYVLHGSTLWQYNAQTGEQIGQLVQSVIDVAPTIDGGWVILGMGQAGDVITRHNAQGEVVATFENLGANYNRRLRPQRVVMGNQFDIYLLIDKEIVHFNPQGNMIDKVSSEGQEDETQYFSPQALAVDTSGRLYVAGWRNIKVYDENGRYLATIDYPATSSLPFNITITIEDELYVMDRNGNQVLKYTLP